MQNWLPGNDYNPGTSLDYLVYTQDQLAATGQLEPGGLDGRPAHRNPAQRGRKCPGLFFYWLATSDTNNINFQVTRSSSDAIKRALSLPAVYRRVLTLPWLPLHGLSKYPYIREGRRIIGSFGLWLRRRVRDHRDRLFHAGFRPGLLPGNPGAPTSTSPCSEHPGGAEYPRHLPGRWGGERHSPTGRDSRIYPALRKGLPSVHHRLPPLPMPSIRWVKARQHVSVRGYGRATLIPTPPRFPSRSSDSPGDRHTC